MVARKVFEHNGYPCVEEVSRVGPKLLTLVRHTLEPYGTYMLDLTVWEYLQWAMACPEQVTLIQTEIK